MPVNTQQQYSALTGLVFVFNLIVGTGALTLPAAFSNAGWLVGICFIVVLAFVSFVTATFVVEAMAASHAISQWRRLEHLRRISGSVQAALQHDHEETDDAEDCPLVANQGFPPQPLEVYAIRGNVEMGEMATLLFNPLGRWLFFACLAIYLYGDLSIYAAAIAKSVADVACTFRPANGTCGGPFHADCNITDVTACWQADGLKRIDAYRIFVATFALLLGPFAFFNVQKTRLLQVATSLTRWFALTFMVSYAAHILLTSGPQGHPPPASLPGVPALFGACVYSFMCHHSLPSLLAPIRQKSHLPSLLFADYLLIGSFYLALALTGAFTFAHPRDLYTLNFEPTPESSPPLRAVQYFLALFPALTLSSSFPVVAVTLRNNLRGLAGVARDWPMALLAVVPPVAVALATSDLQLLVGVTGSYAGVGVQYVAPSLLVMFARREASRSLGPTPNPFSSPFRHPAWPIAALLWAAGCVAVVTSNLVARLAKVS